MNSSVMFGILITVLSHKKVTKRQLAEKFEVSERTVIRYIDALCASGVPIYSIRGKNGGYSIPSEYQFDKTYFTEGELARIRTCLNSMPKFDDKLTKSILDKLEYLNRRKKDEQYLLGTDSLIIDAGPWSNPTLYRAKMETIQRAIDSKKSISIKYVDRYELHSHRLFDPYYRVLKEGVWYTFGWCHTRKDFRLFKLARIASIIETDESFERRECNVYEHLEGHFDDLETIDVEIEFSSTILGDIEEWLGFDAIFERGYKYVARATLYSGRILINKLLSFGSSIKVLEPAFLREELLVECKRILRNAGED
ncbi:MAG: YafY family transcriptional regulator [Clostridia bacterium]|nr:YafY family transcriptional regulator [Clostridia bacterium]